MNDVKNAAEKLSRLNWLTDYDSVRHTVNVSGGFDDIRLARFMAPPLTTVQMSQTEIAQLSFSAFTRFSGTDPPRKCAAAVFNEDKPHTSTIDGPRTRLPE